MTRKQVEAVAGYCKTWWRWSVAGIFFLKPYGVRVCWGYAQHDRPEILLRSTSVSHLFISFARVLHSTARAAAAASGFPLLFILHHADNNKRNEQHKCRSHYYSSYVILYPLKHIKHLVLMIIRKQRLVNRPQYANILRYWTKKEWQHTKNII